MVKSKGTGKSSYNEIVRRLKLTPGWSQLQEYVRQRISQVRLYGIKPGYRNEKTERRFPVFCVSHGEEHITEMFQLFNNESINHRSRYRIQASCLVRDIKVIEQYVMPFFGNKQWCPTYFCKKDKVATECFIEIINEINRNDGPFSVEIAEAEARVKKSIEQAWDDGTVERKIQEWFEDDVVQEIKEVLLKFRNGLEDHVIRRAFHEFVASDVMDS
jgi:hypothetical protein